jgi:hypothetical protein
MTQKSISLVAILVLAGLVVGCQSESDSVVVDTTNTMGEKVSQAVQAVSPSVSVIDEVLIEEDGKWYTPACYKVKDSKLSCGISWWAEEGTASDLYASDNINKKLDYWKKINGIPDSKKIGPDTKFSARAYSYAIVAL